MDIAKVVDGKKFMWDGKTYNREQEAKEITSAYEKEGFETLMWEEEGKYFVYSRRVVKEVVVEGQPPV